MAESGMEPQAALLARNEHHSAVIPIHECRAPLGGEDELFSHGAEP